MTSSDTSDKAMYSASIVDRDTVGCFLDFQLIAPPAKTMTLPDCDRRSSMSPVQSESVYAFNFCLLFSYLMP